MRTHSSLLIGAALGLAFLGISMISQDAAAASSLTPAGEGRRLFLKLNCYGCHGVRGTGGMGPSLIGGDDETQEIVLEGSDDGMPSFRNFVTATDLSNLSAYLRTLGTPNEPTFLHWWEPTPSE